MKSLEHTDQVKRISFFCFHHFHPSIHQNKRLILAICNKILYISDAFDADVLVFFFGLFQAAVIVYFKQKKKKNKKENKTKRGTQAAHSFVEIFKLCWYFADSFRFYWRTRTREGVWICSFHGIFMLHLLSVVKFFFLLLFFSALFFFAALCWLTTDSLKE